MTVNFVKSWGTGESVRFKSDSHAKLGDTQRVKGTSSESTVGLSPYSSTDIRSLRHQEPEERTKFGILTSLCSCKVSIIGLKSLNLSWMDSNCFALQDQPIKGIAELQGMLGLFKIHEAITAHIDTISDIPWKIQKVKQPLKATGNHLFMELLLGKMPRKLPYHNCCRSILPVAGITSLTTGPTGPTYLHWDCCRSSVLVPFGTPQPDIL